MPDPAFSPERASTVARFGPSHSPVPAVGSDEAEQARLRALQRTGLLDSPPEQAFDRLTDLACRLLRVPVALVSFVDADRQFFKSSLGLPEPWATRRETPLSHSFCQHVVAANQPLVIADAREDPRVCDNLAIRDLGVVAYLGIPLVTPEGHVLGSLCAIDGEPRTWTPDEMRVLSGLAESVMTEIALRAQLREREAAVQALQEREAQLRESTDRLSLALEAAKMGTWSWDAETEAIDFSARAAEILGLAPDAPVTRAVLRDLLDEPDRLAVRQAVDQALGGGGPCDVEFRVTRPDGSEGWVSARGKAAYDAVGRPGRMLGVVADVTERKQAEMALRLRAEELARSNRDLEQFAYVASHDLQAPLRSIGGFAQLLARRYRGRLDASADEMLAFIVDGGQQMQALVQDLLTYARAGRAEQAGEPVDLAELIDQVLADFPFELQRVEAEVVTGGLPVVRGDRIQLRQVFQNLIANALKFRHPDRPPRIAVTAEAGEHGVTVQVRDNGIGIPPESRERIFELFGRLHGQAEYEGTGIGLAICKRIVELHEGRIWVDSTPGEASTFSIAFPAHRTLA